MLLTKLVQSFGALALAQLVLGDANQVYRRTNETTDEVDSGDSGAAVGTEGEGVTGQSYNADTWCPHHCKVTHTQKIHVTVTHTLPASTVTLPATTVTEKTTWTETVFTTQTNEVSVSVPVSVTVIKGTTEYITTTQLSTFTTLVPVPTTIKVCNTQSPYSCSTKTTTKLIPTTTTKTIKTTVPTTVTKVKVTTKWKEVTTTKTKVLTYTTKHTIPITVTDSTTLYTTKTEILKTTLTTVETTSVPTTLTQKETQTQTQTQTQIQLVKTTETVPTTILQTSTVVSLVTLTTSFPVTVTDSTTFWSTRTTVLTTTNVSTLTTISTMTTVHAVTATITQLTTTTVSVCPAPTNIGGVKHRALDVRSKKHPRALRTWGCEPGFVCNQPKPGGCNLWAEAPGLDFECHPDYCMPAPYIPRVVWKKNETGYFPPLEGYFNLNPEDFGLTYGIFELEPVVVVRPDGRLATSYTGDWASKATITERPRSTAAAYPKRQVQKRQLGEGASVVPALCFSFCDSAYLEGQRSGRDPEICEPDSVFQRILVDCKSCIEAETDDAKYEEINRVYLQPNFAIYLDYCSALPPVTITTSTTPDPQVTVTPTVSTDTGLPPNTSTGFDDITTSASTTTSSGESSTPTSTPTSTDETTSTPSDSSTEITSSPTTEPSSTPTESSSSTEPPSSETTDSPSTETTDSPSTETTDSPSTETTEVPDTTSGGSESTSSPDATTSTADAPSTSEDSPSATTTSPSTTPPTSSPTSPFTSLPGSDSSSTATGGSDDLLTFTASTFSTDTLPGETSGGGVPTDTPITTTTIAGTGGLTPTQPTGPVVTAAAGRMASVPSLGGLGNILALILFAAMLF